MDTALGCWCLMGSALVELMETIMNKLPLFSWQVFFQNFTLLVDLV
jgi:hypothetical protein